MQPSDCGMIAGTAKTAARLSKLRRLPTNPIERRNSMNAEITSIAQKFWRNPEARLRAFEVGPGCPGNDINSVDQFRPIFLASIAASSDTPAYRPTEEEIKWAFHDWLEYISCE
jgi:hypothetical protein